MVYPLYTDPVPALTTGQMIEVDRAMIEDYQIGLIQMMENAGRSLAQLARARFLHGDPRGKKVVVMAGTGGNGGGALDTPSGLDTTSGKRRNPAVQATATLTLALPKTGLLLDEARTDVGELYLADIGVPPALYARPPLNLAVGPVFATSDVVRLY